MSEKTNKVGYDVSRLTKKLGLDYATIQRDLPKGSAGVFPTPAAGTMTAVSPKDVAPPHMVRFAVAIKPRGGGEWPSRYREAITIARRRYDEGTHEMCSGHERGFVILYSIPRKKPDQREGFFNREWGMKK